MNMLSMKSNIKATLKKILSNKIVLNVVSAISLLNFLGYLMMGQMDQVLFFIALGLVTSYFCKNMIVVLIVPLILVNLYTINENNRKNMYMLREGLENKEESVDSSKLDKDDITTKKNDEGSKSSQGLPLTSLNTNNKISNSKDNDADVDESFEVSRSNKNSSYNIDYASTIEDAYDELNNVLGSDGIKNLTNDTQNLMKQQTQLAEAMKGMGPLLEGMGPLMKQVEGLMGTFKGNKK